VVIFGVADVGDIGSKGEAKSVVVAVFANVAGALSIGNSVDVAGVVGGVRTSP